MTIDSQTNLLLYGQYTGIVTTIMSGRKPFWKPYEIPEACQRCPYITSLEKTIEDQGSTTAVDGVTALGIGGLASELRGRKRKAQDCIGPVALAESDLVYCDTIQRALAPAGEAVTDDLDRATRRQIRGLTDIAGLFPDLEPPEEQ